MLEKESEAHGFVRSYKLEDSAMLPLLTVQSVLIYPICTDIGKGMDKN